MLTAVVIGHEAEVLSQSGLTYTYVDSVDGRLSGVSTVSVIGHPVKHTVKKGDTLLDIARHYGLGFNEMEDLYPEMDPWLPPEGKELIIPSMWVLPQADRSGIVVNIAELRLYHFLVGQSFKKNSGNNFHEKFENDFSDTQFARTYPVGIGDEKFTTPAGQFRVDEKRTRPFWYIPPSLQEKYAPVTIVPPGPDNPLGGYFMGIGDAYGIHGTNNPWSVGRLVTHGCIRLYPEDMESLYYAISVGTPVQIIYEPVKIGIRNGKIYMEVHRDIYNRIADFYQYSFRKLSDSGLINDVDTGRFEAELKRKSGMPVEVGSIGMSRN
ncbi:MAG: L,D-transpeptidase family protein [Desulfobacterales bacterium]